MFVCIFALSLVVLTACSNIEPKGVSDEDHETVSDNAPHLRPDGGKYRFAYVDYDEYLPASRQLYFILKGLEEEGWIAEGSIPFTAEDIETYELSTKDMYEKLVDADLGEYVSFAKDEFFYIGYADEDKIKSSLLEGAGSKFDLVITFGTSAGLLVSSLDLPVPMVDFSATDPVASGIIESATEGSGKPNVWAQVEASVPLRQLKYYHSLKPFKNLGIVIYADEMINGVPDIMKAGEEVGFNVVEYLMPEQPRETDEQWEEHYRLVAEEFKKMANEDIDAFFLTLDLVYDMSRLPSLLEPFYQKNIPVYVLDDVNNVYNGALMIICAYDLENVGRFVANAITKILSGYEAGSLPCIYTSAPYICVNLDVAKRLDYKLNFEFLAICDEIYTEGKDR